MHNAIISLKVSPVILSPSTLKAVTVKFIYTVCNLGVPLDLTLVFQNQIPFVESVQNAIISLKVSLENMPFFFFKIRLLLPFGELPYLLSKWPRTILPDSFSETQICSLHFSASLVIHSTQNRIQTRVQVISDIAAIWISELLHLYTPSCPFFCSFSNREVRQKKQMVTILSKTKWPLFSLNHSFKHKMVTLLIIQNGHSSHNLFRNKVHNSFFPFNGQHKSNIISTALQRFPIPSLSQPVSHSWNSHNPLTTRTTCLLSSSLLVA